MTTISTVLNSNAHLRIATRTFILIAQERTSFKCRLRTQEIHTVESTRMRCIGDNLKTISRISECSASSSSRIFNISWDRKRTLSRKASKIWFMKIKLKPYKPWWKFNNKSKSSNWEGIKSSLTLSQFTSLQRLKSLLHPSQHTSHPTSADSTTSITMMRLTVSISLRQFWWDFINSMEMTSNLRLLLRGFKIKNSKCSLLMTSNSWTLEVKSP